MASHIHGEIIRVRGLVQGVGFRPAVWRLATACGLSGDVRNEGTAVLIRAWGPAPARRRFLQRLHDEAPPLACMDTVETAPVFEPPPATGFRIVASSAGEGHAGILPDTATCAECLTESAAVQDRRFGYAFTNCTHCGPRLSIVHAMPYDRGRTSMAGFTMCPACRAEYEDPASRRFHAQPNACPVCGPRLLLEDARGTVLAAGHSGTIDAACALIDAGHIVAVKGIGGFHLMADARNPRTVMTLRRRKRRDEKPFALMAPDVETIERYCAVGARERELLESRAAPIVVLSASGSERVAAGIAPGVRTLGFMLPYTPLHHLMLRQLARPVVLTSGNTSDEPQCIDNDEARARLATLADYLLLHDRPIVTRVDDSVARVAGGAPRLLRRARGYAPAPLPMPAGFAAAPAVLAMGGELKNTFCLLEEGQAVLSQHIGDLEDAATYRDFCQSLAHYRRLFRHDPKLIAVDMHPEYLAAKLGRELAESSALPVAAVQHHHAHVASCLAENGVALDSPPVLGIALDGLGYGDDGTFWGGEFLLADYTGYRRLASLRPVPLLGGTKAVHEPWRNTYAHLCTSLGWQSVAAAYAELELCDFLAARPLKTLDAMREKRLNSPLASSCGRLFDAVAAAVGIRRERASYEGQAAVELEASIDAAALAAAKDGYPFALTVVEERTILDSAPIWPALLDDLARGLGRPAIAARFHVGLARAVVDTVQALACRSKLKFDTVVLSGGVFQNRVLLERVDAGLRAAGFAVLAHAKVPTNDGGLALGQAAVAAARWLAAH